jgi:hypothetical protein
MPKKEKEFPPKDMKELGKIFYGESGDGKDIDWDCFRRYGSWIQGEAYSPSFEAVTMQIFSPLGIVEKIREINGKKTFDFRINQSKILLESTSLTVAFTVLPTTFDDNLLFRKLQEAIVHIKEKDAPALPDFFKGGIIFYETVFNFMTRFHLKLNSELPRLAHFLDNGLDFLAFVPQPASIDGRSSFDVFPIVFYIKEGPLVEKFRNTFADKNYIVIVYG